MSLAVSVTDALLADLAARADACGTGQDDWYGPEDMKSLYKDGLPWCDADLLIAASPAVILALVDEIRALREAVQRVREVHYAAPVCADCQGKAGTHPCGCWAPEDREPVCGGCGYGYKFATTPWPCPTIKAVTTPIRPVTERALA